MVDTARLQGRLFALRTDINGLLHTAGRLVRRSPGAAPGRCAGAGVLGLDRKEAAAAELRRPARAPPAGEAALAVGRRDPDGSLFAAFFGKGAGSCPFSLLFGGRGCKNTM